MFIGHFGVGFGAKKAAPGISLGVLFIAAQFIDLLWPLLLLLNIEHASIVPGITKTTPLDFTDYPISHSFIFVLFWGIIVGFIYWLIRKKIKSALIITSCVVSHWLLDLLVHRPDLPLFPGNSLKVGLGLWNFPVFSVIIEFLIFAAGLYLYVNKTTYKNKKGKYGLVFLAGLLAVIYLMNIIGPPPPDIITIALAGNLQWLFILLAFWVDRNRTVKV